MRKVSILRPILLLSAILGLAFAAGWSLRLVWADYLSRSADPRMVARASRLVPSDADVDINLANVTEATGANPSSALESAAALDPGNAAIWMRLGLLSEMHGDRTEAESRLLRAASVSHQFEPRWTLASFYSRQGDAVHFWPWANAALLMAYGNLDPVFDLCWHMSEDAALILERAIPERQAVLAAYLSFLLQRNRQEATQAVALRLAPLATPDEKDILLAWCDRQLDSGSVPPAIEVWNVLCARRLLAYPPLDAGSVRLIDGNFRSAPLNSAFGWRLATIPGVSTGRNSSPPYLWFSLDGKQPETCELLAQSVPVKSGARYRLQFEYRTSDIPQASGLRWHAFDSRTNTDLAARAPWLSGVLWKSEALVFTTSPDTTLVRLALTYQRLPGNTRIEGSVSLRNLSLEMLP